MNIYYIFLKGLHKIYVKCSLSSAKKQQNRIGIITNPDEASSCIYQLLISEKPCMVARYGSTELLNVTNYLSVKDSHHSALDYIMEKRREWWWNEKSCEQIKTHSGFFPNTKENIARFSEMMCEDTAQLDFLGSWIENEKYMENLFPPTLQRTCLTLLEPYWSSQPWTKALEGKRVVVVHPFAELIEFQYKEKRTRLFENPDVLPEFQLRVVKAVQSLGGDCDGFKDWFEALDWMKEEIGKEDYDVALIGCGAYGFPLAAHVKRMGKKAVHLGGSLQLLFGIKGKRWENPAYGQRTLGGSGRYLELFNEHWTYPDASCRPKSADKVEGGCYW